MHIEQIKAFKKLLEIYMKENESLKSRCDTLTRDNYQLERELIRKNEIIQQYEDPSREVSE